MSWCECCGCRSHLLRQEQRVAFMVDVYQCRNCGEWEDYRVPPQPTVTLEVLQERHEVYLAKELEKARKRWQARKAQRQQKVEV